MKKYLWAPWTINLRKRSRLPWMYLCPGILLLSLKLTMSGGCRAAGAGAARRFQFCCMKMWWAVLIEGAAAARFHWPRDANHVRHLFGTTHVSGALLARWKERHSDRPACWRTRLLLLAYSPSMCLDALHALQGQVSLVSILAVAVFSSWFLSFVALKGSWGLFTILNLTYHNLT